MADVQARLVPFHCSVEPPVATADDNYAENEIMEPFCSALLDRKRRFEQNVRWRFNHDNTGLAEGEELLMERLRIVRAHSLVSWEATLFFLSYDKFHASCPYSTSSRVSFHNISCLL